ncbi:MAG: sensor histidine kinase [Leptospiraceae bacterium]|nr:sensor histidine kinase [Leptospiraceae bacterium]MCK6379887.1 sensor histidine kinase [Leptospiraceae bacterium]NUM40232.1 sensor histidine kinase [Leptospiraceae bacterium]
MFKTIVNFIFKKLFVVSVFLFILYIPDNLLSEDCNSVIGSFDNKISLTSGWMYRRGDNPDWKDPLMDDSLWTKKNLPDYGKDKSVKIIGYHWYRCKFYIPENLKEWNEPLSISLGEVRDVDEVYFNGNLIGSTGQTVPTLSVDLHKFRVYTIPKKFFINGSNLIAIRIYSSTNTSGFIIPPAINNQLEITKSVARKNIFGIMSGYVFLMMGIFFIMASIVKSTNRGNLFFSLFSIALGFYTLLRTQYRYRIFEDFALSFKIELIIVITLPVLFVNFLYMYLNQKRNLLLYVYEIGMMILLLFTFISKTTSQWTLIIDIFNLTLIYPMALVLFTIYKNYQTNKSKIKYIFIGMIGLVPTIIIDSLTAIELIKLPGTVYLGFMFFLINISIQLSDEMVESLKNYLDQEKELIKMEKIKTDFLWNVSHEFKIYMDELGKIISSTIQGLKPSKNPKLNLDEIDLYVGLSLSTFKDAITLKSVEDKSFVPIITRFSIREVIVEAIETVEKRLGQKRKNKTVTIHPPDFETTNSKKLLFLIAYHLIENAYKYSGKTDRIHISFKSELGKGQLIISDEGPGISKEVQTNIFNKFVRGGFSGKESENVGSGIGLTLVKASVEYLGGTIELQSQNGFGTKVMVVLPLKAA